MGVTCQILINKVKDVYKPGQAVTGRVKFYVDEQTEYKDVVLALLGKGKCTWKRGSGKSSRTYYGREEYVTTLVNICNKKPEDETITLEGEYEYPFEFFLPENIPRSYKDIHSSIKYYIELKFEKPSFFSFNTVFTAEIPVYSYIKQTLPDGPVIFGIRKTLFAPFASKTPEVNFKAEIEKTCVTPGENVNLSYLVMNDSDVEVTSVKTELYCCTTYTADCGGTLVVTDKVNSCEAETSSVPERGVSKFSCLLPTLPELYSITDSKIISKKYLVRVTLRLPIPHLNATGECLLLIGDRKGSVDPCTELEENVGSPPSYWAAMKEKNKSKK